MERLTKKDEKGCFFTYLFSENVLEIEDMWKKEHTSKVGYKARGNLINRLAAYEDTGLTPEGIRILQAANVLLQKQADLAHEIILAIEKEMTKAVKEEQSK